MCKYQNNQFIRFYLNWVHIFIDHTPIFACNRFPLRHFNPLCRNIHLQHTNLIELRPEKPNRKIEQKNRPQLNRSVFQWKLTCASILSSFLVKCASRRILWLSFFDGDDFIRTNCKNSHFSHEMFIPAENSIEFKIFIYFWKSKSIPRTT